MKLSIIIPCYNESDNILLLLDKFNQIIDRKDVELILVNNGSTDKTADILNQHLSKYKFARSIYIETNLGYGNGIICGLKTAIGDYLCYTHADMQTNPSDVLKALSIIENQNDPKQYFIKGYRKQRPFLDNFFTTGMSLFESIYLKEKLWDINAQPNLFHKSFFNSLVNYPIDFSLDLFFLYNARKKGISIIRFDVLFPRRVYGNSKWNTGLLSKWKFIKRTISYTIKLKKQL